MQRCKVEIRINDHPVDFELQGEKKIGEIIDSLSGWARDRDLVFFEADINGVRYAIDSLPEMGIDAVKTVNCVFKSRADMVLSTGHEAFEYCGRIIRHIEKANGNGGFTPANFAELLSGLEWLCEVILKVAGILGIDSAVMKYADRPLSAHIDELKNVTAGLKDHQDRAGIRAVAVAVESARNIIMMLFLSDEMKTFQLKSVDAPDEIAASLHKLKKDLASQADNLELTAIAFQTGKDRDGAERLNSFIDFIFRYIRAAHQSVKVFGIDPGSIEVKGETLEASNESLRGLLVQAMESMENGDIISLSDVLEYEIKPAVEDLEAFLDVLIQKSSS